jgi:hypothetical protein
MANEGVHFIARGVGNSNLALRKKGNQIMNPQIFEEHSAGLYWLAYLLTGTEDSGVEAFSRALDHTDATGEQVNSTFDGFMSEWARKLVIVEALGAIEPALIESLHRLASSPAAQEQNATPSLTDIRQDISEEDFEKAVIAIDTFPRCAMLLTIFEGMSLTAAALLLNADERLTAVAQRIGIVQLTHNLAGAARVSAHALSS